MASYTISYLFLKPMKIQHKPITNQEQYDVVANRMEQLIDADPNSEGSKELKLLTRLIVECEKRRPTASPEQGRMT